MRHPQSGIGHNIQIQSVGTKVKGGGIDDFVLEKSIFNNIFEKDIRRVFIYKKAERLAKALHLIAPAFISSTPLRDRVDTIAVGLVDAAVLPHALARTALARELLALSSVLGVARVGGLLSAMNADLIAHEAHTLLQEVAAYEEPRIFLDDAPTLAGIAKLASKRDDYRTERAAAPQTAPRVSTAKRAVASSQGHTKDNPKEPNEPVKDRREAVLSVIREKKSVSIKDISTMIRGVSEKTIQRELAGLVDAGTLVKTGERRWSTYSLA